MSDLNENPNVDKIPIENVDDEENSPSISDRVIGGIGSLISSAANKWEDYTRDVREEVPDAEDAQLVNVRPVTQVSVPTSYQGAHVKPVKRAKGILGAFVDGIVGRPHVPSSEKNNGGTLRTVIKTVVCIFSVIGVVAVIRASIDAFKPRR